MQHPVTCCSKQAVGRHMQQRQSSLALIPLSQKRLKSCSCFCCWLLQPAAGCGWLQLAAASSSQQQPACTTSAATPTLSSVPIFRQLAPLRKKCPNALQQPGAHNCNPALVLNKVPSRGASSGVDPEVIKTKAGECAIGEQGGKTSCTPSAEDILHAVWRGHLACRPTPAWNICSTYLPVHLCCGRLATDWTGLD